MSTDAPPLSRSSAVHVAGAFVLMGGWAMLANRIHPMPAPLLAGLVQGTLSACITYGLKGAVEMLSRRFRGVGALLVPPAMAAVISATVLSLLHWWSGTPEVPATIIVPLFVSTSYAALYSVALWRAREG